MTIPPESSPEYAHYQPDGFGHILICPCGVSEWEPAMTEEGIGGRKFWFIGEAGDIDKPSIDFGCTKCKRIVSIENMTGTNPVVGVGGRTR